MTILELMKETKFTGAEQLVVDYMHSQKYELANKTLKVAAKESFTSPSTFIRVANKLNFDGWNDLKSTFLKELTYFERDISTVDLNIPFSKNDSVLSIANKITELKKNTFDDIVDLLSYKELTKAVDYLNQRKSITIFASSVNLLLAEEFQFKMKRLKYPVTISSLESEHIYDALNMEEESCAILISYTGSSVKMLEIADILKDRRIPIIAITSFSDNILSKNANAILFMATRERLYSKVGHYSTNTSVTHLLDILYSALFAKNFESNMDHIVSTSKIADIRLATSRAMEE
ncbi:MurR/RpiR family transcriptional regulator [Enterococcus pallens]|uniref:Phosphosugar-binding transcriptional regulator n=1 Tax=Enterococcus pallens ATCC BAA-351 TaxID=1158607 RepID=R2SE89_9ENTE|nr:MurR/RpiR family transcriptional regulator [Enterococcus pallens]EOH91201.1 hypothetical protein UAU_03740 [Enterococcus pallens ATCC BAA-351]EOU11431.1 hypothetical protein I588_05100 [Enterococcus pallens ATCC BAA-351]OJG78050.1 hypothetical protein RV10_GL002072 [Enterococcus pallens]